MQRRATQTLKTTCCQMCFSQRSELLLAINLFVRNCPSRFFSDGRICFRSRFWWSLNFHDLCVTRLIAGIVPLQLCVFFFETVNTEHCRTSPGVCSIPPTLTSVDHAFFLTGYVSSLLPTKLSVLVGRCCCLWSPCSMGTVFFFSFSIWRCLLSATAEFPGCRSHCQ